MAVAVDRRSCPRGREVWMSSSEERRGVEWGGPCPPPGSELTEARLDAGKKSP